MAAQASSRYTGQLYQLYSSHPLKSGDYVEVNGPWDRYGIVQRSEPKDGRYLNLIRGAQARAGQTPLARF